MQEPIEPARVPSLTSAAVPTLNPESRTEVCGRSFRVRCGFGRQCLRAGHPEACSQGLGKLLRRLAASTDDVSGRPQRRACTSVNAGESPHLFAGEDAVLLSGQRSIAGRAQHAERPLNWRARQSEQAVYCSKALATLTHQDPQQGLAEASRDAAENIGAVVLSSEHSSE